MLKIESLETLKWSEKWSELFESSLIVIVDVECSSVLKKNYWNKKFLSFKAGMQSPPVLSSTCLRGISVRNKKEKKFKLILILGPP